MAFSVGVLLNTLEYAKRLEAAGVSRKQAEAHIQIISNVVEVDMATKQDLREMEYRLTIRICTIMSGITTTLIGLAVALIKMT